MKLALFDVDFTLTSKETLIYFFRYLLRKKPSLYFHIPKALLSGVLYQMGVNKEKKTKELFLSFMANMPLKTVDELTNDFIKHEMPKIIYKDGIDKINELKEKGYTVVLTSASPEFYILKLKEVFGADYVMGTKFEEKNELFTGKMFGENNKGEEKVLRLLQIFDGISIDFENSYMFSDSMSDDPLLKLVGNPYLINYKKKNPKYPVLNWR